VRLLPQLHLQLHLWQDRQHSRLFLRGSLIGPRSQIKVRQHRHTQRHQRQRRLLPQPPPW
jgi:hypothetical protein